MYINRNLDYDTILIRHILEALQIDSDGFNMVVLTTERGIQAIPDGDTIPDCLSEAVNITFAKTPKLVGFPEDTTTIHALLLEMPYGNWYSFMHEDKENYVFSYDGNKRIELEDVLFFLCELQKYRGHLPSELFEKVKEAYINGKEVEYLLRELQDVPPVPLNIDVIVQQVCDMVSSEIKEYINKENKLNEAIAQCLTQYKMLLNDMKALQKEHRLKNTQLDMPVLRNLLEFDKGITNFTVKNFKISWNYTTPLLYYSENDFKILYSALLEDSNQTDMYALLQDVIINKTHNLYFKTTLKISINTNSFGGTYPTSTTISNPHLAEYSCFGNNAVPIRQALENKDIAMAVLQMNVASAGLNVVDIPVMQALNNNLKHNKDTVCIEVKETKEMISFKEYLERRNTCKE